MGVKDAVPLALGRVVAILLRLFLGLVVGLASAARVDAVGRRKD